MIQKVLEPFGKPNGVRQIMQNLLIKKAVDIHFEKLQKNGSAHWFQAFGLKGSAVSLIGVIPLSDRSH